MKKSFLLACLVSVCAAPSFAQSPANAEGARLVAQRDAAYAKAHPAPVITRIAPVVHHGRKHRAHRKAVNKVTK
jgi:hypothetical protein